VYPQCGEVVARGKGSDSVEVEVDSKNTQTQEVSAFQCLIFHAMSIDGGYTSWKTGVGDHNNRQEMCTCMCLPETTSVDVIMCMLDRE
jgi:hypothetical protein